MWGLYVIGLLSFWLALFVCVKECVSGVTAHLAEHVAFNYPGFLVLDVKNKARAENRMLLEHGVGVAVRAWFSVGAAFGVVAGLGSFLFLAYNFASSLYAVVSVKDAATSVAATMTPLVPGVTFPWSDLWIFGAAVSSAVLWHEFGHGGAAVGDSVRIDSIGAVLIAVLPGAYVRLSADLHNRPWTTQLRIQYAGVWHNLVSVATAFFILWTLQYWLAPAWTPAEGVVVASIPSTSPFYGALTTGTIITALNHRPVRSSADWSSLLGGLGPMALDPSTHTPLRNPVGLCVSPSLSLASLSSSPDDCCPADDPSSLCFQVWDTAPLGTSNTPPSFTCANAKSTALQSVAWCDRWHPDCAANMAELEAEAARYRAEHAPDDAPASDQRPGSRIILSTPSATTTTNNNDGYYCSVPVLPSDDLRLMVLGLANGSQAVFLGTPSELFGAFVPTDFRVRDWLGELRPAWGSGAAGSGGSPDSFWGWYWSWIDGYPVMAVSFLRFFVVVSMSMAVFNAAPVAYTDGEHATKTTVLRLYSAVPSLHNLCAPRQLADLLIKITTGMLCVNIALSLLALAF